MHTDTHANIAPMCGQSPQNADNMRTEIELAANAVALLKMPMPVKELAAIIDHSQAAYGPGLRLIEQPKGWLQLFRPTITTGA